MAGQRLLEDLNDPQSRDTIILSLNGKIYTRSAAALMIIKHLDGPLKLLYGFIIVPNFIREWIYRIIAKNRYRWFGKRNECMIPSKDTEDRFIEN